MQQYRTHLSLKFCVFGFSDFGILAGNWCCKVPAKFCFKYYRISNDGFWKNSSQGCQKWKNFFKYAYPLKRYSVLNVQFSTILLLKIAQNGRKFKFQKISNFYIVKNFPVNCFKTKEDEWGWAFLMSHMPTVVPMKIRVPLLQSHLWY